MVLNNNAGGHLFEDLSGVGAIPEPMLKTGTISAALGGNVLKGVGLVRGQFVQGDYIWFNNEGREIMNIAPDYDRIQIAAPFTIAVPALTPLYTVKTRYYRMVSIRNTTGTPGTIDGKIFTASDTFDIEEESGLKPFFYNTGASVFRVIAKQ